VPVPANPVPANPVLPAPEISATEQAREPQPVQALASERADPVNPIPVVPAVSAAGSVPATEQAKGLGSGSPAGGIMDAFAGKMLPKQTWSIGLPPLPFIMGAGFLTVLLVGCIVFHAARRFHLSPYKVMAYAARPLKENEKKPAAKTVKNAELHAISASDQHRRNSMVSWNYPAGKPAAQFSAKTDTGPLMLSLFVADQSTAIGRRNVHIVKPGYNFTIGGGKSDFLIFLVPIPSRIAELRFNGEECTFIPRKPQFFPDIGVQPVPDCIGKTIRIISERNYELYIRMECYEDPLITLNRLLHSIRVPG
jgi:hypothetical protein